MVTLKKKQKERKMAMREARQERPVRTVPDGVWEASRPEKKENRSRNASAKDPAVDAQGNGYPDHPGQEGHRKAKYR